jgi:acyl-homoserine lactone acylase PvdQ
VSRRIRSGALATALALLLSPAFAPPAGASSGCLTLTGPAGAPYQDCGGGQVYNILPPGEAGLVNGAQFATHQLDAHAADQRSMYADLLQVAPNLTPAQVGRYFKQAGLAPTAGDVARVYSPGPGTVIVRDKSFGVPHVFGSTRAATEFGAGYAAAEDRLFMMDVFRHIGRSTVSSFLGPSATALTLDCEVAQVAGYTDAEFQAQIDNLPRIYTARFDATHDDGQQVVEDGTNYINGVNAYIQAALTNPNLMPVEYPALQEVPLPFKPTDVVAIATIVQAIFAVGGGNEVQSALLYQSLVQRYGATKGGQVWNDLRSQNDPGAQTTLSTAFPYMLVPSSVDPMSVAMPAGDPQTTYCNNGVPPSPGGLGQISVAGVTIDLTSLLHPNRHASNAILVTGSHTASGHPIAVFGPQVAYFAPEILHEEDLHGPGLNARGAAFIGTDIYVELGRGADYSWSATSAGSDLIDQRMERLCDPAGGPATLSSTSYVYNGKCVPMYERTDREVAKSNPGSPNPPQVITIQVERTVHGPVMGRLMAIDPATGKQIPAAVSIERSTFGDELGSAPAFMDWNDPDKIHSASDFMKAAAKETGTFNWFYADSRDIAYYSSGKLPVRNPNVNPNFPVWGTGQWDWRGFLPATGLPNDPHPHVINPTSGFLANWNNKPAPGWSASDSQFGYGPVYRSQSLADRVRALVARGSIGEADMINAMEDAGSVDLDGSQLVNQLRAALNGATLTPAQSQVLGILGSWAAGGAHRRAIVDYNRYDEGTAVAVMDQLYPRLAHAIFDPWLDSGQFSRMTGIMGLNNPPGALGSAYDGGWEGYLQRSLAQAVNPSLTPRYSQSYCGSANLAPCQAALIAALQATIDAETSAYGSSNPASWTCDRANSGAGQCNPAADDIVFTAVGVESIPNMHWVNRPTFQQVVEYPAHR